MKRSETTYEVTAKARRAYAESVFDLATVVAAIRDRATEGYRCYRISQIYPFDLSDSEAALALMQWLEDEYFRYAWQHTPEIIDPFHPVETGEYPELVVFW